MMEVASYLTEKSFKDKDYVQKFLNYWFQLNKEGWEVTVRVEDNKVIFLGQRTCE